MFRLAAIRVRVAPPRLANSLRSRKQNHLLVGPSEQSRAEESDRFRTDPRYPARAFIDRSSVNNGHVL
jgi:hypothetical protein